MPQAQLLKYLEVIGDPRIGMDCSIMPTRFPSTFAISTTDFFFPLVDDPYMQGMIACANVLSDMYAMGVVDVDSMLMLLGVCREMKPDEQEVVTRAMMRGFHDQATAAGTSVTGGQTVKNPWPLIGGVAFSLCTTSEFIRPVHAVAGDVILLTKPLGTNIAVNMYQWRLDQAKWARIADVTDMPTVQRAYDAAVESMALLNREGARLMLKHGAHAATDVTGFGLMGHANNLASNQEAAVSFEIDLLPLLPGTKAGALAWSGFKMAEATYPETSGGLLICIDAAAAPAFCADFAAAHPGLVAHVVGRVVAGERVARLAPDVRIVEAPFALSSSL